MSSVATLSDNVDVATSSYTVKVISNEGETDERVVPLREPRGAQVLVKVDSCAICTLEQRVFSGTMKRYPFAGGHEVAGTVVAVGDDVLAVNVGDNVAVRLLTSCGQCYYCRSGHENQCVSSFKASIHEGLNGPGGFAEFMVVDAGSVYRMEDDVPLTEAALTEPLACCVHSVRTGNVEFGDDVVVIGVGIMGGFHIQLAKLRGARVIVCEPDDDRRVVALELGADVLIDPTSEDAVERVSAVTEGRGADVVFCTVARTEVAVDAVAMAGKLARVVFYSSFHPDNPIEVSPNKIHSKETIITGAVNPNRSDFLAASRLISHRLVDVKPLISGEVSLNEIDQGLSRALDPSTYRIVVRCNQTQ